MVEEGPEGEVVRGVDEAESVTLDVRALVGSGDRIALFSLPFVIVALALNARYPSRFAFPGQPKGVRAISAVAFISGVAIWAWSVALILTRVPRGELITSGPYSLVRHPLYTSVALLVLPAAGFLRNTWLGAAIGLIVYAGSRRYAPAEEAELSRTFGGAWEAYRRSVRLASL